MRIFTSSWFTKLPDTIQKIGISRGTPRGYPAGYRKMSELAPGPWFNTGLPPREFKTRYMNLLQELDPGQTMRKMERLGDGRDVALLCYEAPGSIESSAGQPKIIWCHRALTSAWLHDTMGLEVREFTRQEDGFGWQHPLLPHELRRGPAPAPEPLDVPPYLGRKAVDDNGHTWEVLGRNQEFPDQADIANLDTGEIRSVSESVLQTRFAA